MSRPMNGPAEDLVAAAARTLLVPAAARDALLLELRNWMLDRAETNTSPVPAHEQTATEGARRLAAGDESGVLWLAAAEAMKLRATTEELEQLLEQSPEEDR